jgi:hypothetical protein
MVHDDQVIYGGISVDLSLMSESHIAIALRDDTDLLDFIVKTLSAPDTHSSNIGRKIIAELRDYSDSYSEKIIGVALARSLHSRCVANIPEKSLCTPGFWIDNLNSKTISNAKYASLASERCPLSHQGASPRSSSDV